MSTPRRIADLPCPPGLPLLGNALQLDPSRLHLSFEQWAQQYGPIFRVQVGPKPLLVISDEATALHVLRDRPEAFGRLSTFEPVGQELGINGLFTAEGETWRRQRKVWLSSINAHQLRGFHLQLQQITQRLLRRWQGAADRGQVLDVVAELTRYTVDVTMLFALGHPANTLEQGEDIIQQHLNQIFPALGRRMAAPFAYWRWFKLPADRALDRALVALRGDVNALIEAARQRLRDEPARRAAPSCFLEALLLEHEADPANFSEQDVFANVITVLLAGGDTTANTLAWLVHYGCEHPQVYAGLSAEADALMGDAQDDDDVPLAERFPAYLPRTDAALNEVMRLHPVAPVFGITVKRDTELCGVSVPAGTNLFLAVRAAVGCAPSSTPTPRFAPGDKERDGGAGRGPSLPFGHGPRLCPGRNIALAEMRSVCLMLARHFTLEAVPGPEPVRERFAFTLVPENLRVRLHRRTPRLISA